MIKHERLAALLRMVSEQGAVEVNDAVKALQVSHATVRRDLDALEAQQLIRRTHGGAVATASAFDIAVRHRRDDTHAAAKQRIAEAATELVVAGSVVAINGGTTTSALARAIGSRNWAMQQGIWPSLTVVTNAVNIATELAAREAIRTVVTGGVARPRSYELTGPFATAVLSEVLVDTAFLGVDALDPEIGAAARHEDEALVNRAFADRAKRVVILATADKVGASSFESLSWCRVRHCALADWLPNAAWRHSGATVSKPV